VFINPLAGFLWLGGLVFLTGGAVAVWPPAQAQPLPTPRARRRTAGTAVALTAGLLILGAAGLSMWRPGAGDVAAIGRRPGIGQPAPQFDLALIDGTTLSTAQHQGRVWVLNFWATWCSPCEDELPDLQTVWEEYQDQDVVVVGIAIHDPAELDDVEAMRTQSGITYPVGLDPREEIAGDYGITGVPETFVVDATGHVAYIHVGPVTAALLREELDSVLAR